MTFKAFIQSMLEMLTVACLSIVVFANIGGMQTTNSVWPVYVYTLYLFSAIVTVYLFWLVHKRANKRVGVK